MIRFCYTIELTENISRFALTVESSAGNVLIQEHARLHPSLTLSKGMEASAKQKNESRGLQGIPEGRITAERRVSSFWELHSRSALLSG